MHHDVIHDRYGRLYEIPSQLSRCSNTAVNAYCLSYRRSDEGTVLVDGQTSWKSSNTVPNILRHTRSLSNDIKRLRPEVVISSSDLFHIVLAWLLAKKHDLPFVADLYDNYESFGMARVPALKPLYRRALKSADHVITVSEVLNEHVRKSAKHDRVTTIESTINKGQFFKMEQREARERISMKFDDNLIYLGLCGGLNKLHGVNLFLEGFAYAQSLNSRLRLILAGHLDIKLPVPDTGITYIGALEHCQMNNFYNAMDINAISMLENCFGKYAFPQKAYEIAATRTPCMVPNFGPMARLFCSLQHSYYRPGDPLSISETLLQLASEPETANIPIPTWQDHAKSIRSILSSI